MRVDRKLNSTDVIDVLTDLFILRGPPAFVRSDNGPEFVAKAVRAWIEAVGAKTAYIEPGSSWENGCVESFNARFRDDLLDGEVFYSLAEAKIVIEDWRRDFNAVRPPFRARMATTGPPKAPSRCPHGPSCTNDQHGPADGGPTNLA